MIRTGVLGGTFDPIHKAHLGIAAGAMREYGLREVWLMPAGDPYFKADKEVTPPLERLYMTQLAVRDSAENFRVSDLELRLTGDTHTAETMELLKRRFPNREFSFIIGADSLMNLKLWFEVGRLFRCCTVLCAARPDSGGLEEMEEEIRSLKELYSPCDIRIIHSVPTDISSTKIRQSLWDEQGAESLVTPRVARFIRARGLYSGTHFRLTDEAK